MLGTIIIIISHLMLPVSPSLACSYLYFVNATKIVRCHLDGSFHETVVEEGMYDQFKSLSIDEETNTLFWTLHSLKKSFIKSMSIADFEANRENAVSFC